jgi:hypothetical protein
MLPKAIVLMYKTSLCTVICFSSKIEFRGSLRAKSNKGNTKFGDAIVEAV